MTEQAILEKAIKKAIDNGFISVSKGRWAFTPDAKVVLVVADKREDVYMEQVIYSHDFAKALWGEPRINAEPVAIKDGGNTIEFEAISGWQYHLQRMVIADDPIKYLGDHLND